MELLARLQLAGLAGDRAYALPLTQELMADALGLSVPARQPHLAQAARGPADRAPRQPAHLSRYSRPGATRRSQISPTLEPENPGPLEHIPSGRNRPVGKMFNKYRPCAHFRSDGTDRAVVAYTTGLLARFHLSGNRFSASRIAGAFAQAINLHQ